jgi:hypothetical protein
VDTLYKRGLRSAHFVWCMGAGLVGAVVGVIGYTIPNP